MKISPKTEQKLIRGLDHFEKFSMKLKEFIGKVLRGFSWLYLVGMCFLYFSVVVKMVTQPFNAASLIWLILTSGGLIGLYSYLATEYIGHTHLWKVWLFLTIIVYIAFGLSNTLPFLILAFPTLYALYKIGFDNQFHELLCMIKKENIAKWERAIYKELQLLRPGSTRIVDLEFLRFLVCRLHYIPHLSKVKKS